ncbi:Hypothetical protein BRZCDTV_173 [Brazilian cedratvirus IHUMI]|uniref:Uncharacterized protein n=1 Tax=Brazilian cedratvirus IHUMI TaxID=2126980 RepID=A0A2R8FDS0_9VIRU|nr:Hypothetical protein BRZCDTV_173 [Brazilian cedratvirus IHUMI]
MFDGKSKGGLSLPSSTLVKEEQSNTSYQTWCEEKEGVKQPSAILGEERERATIGTLLYFGNIG